VSLHTDTLKALQEVFQDIRYLIIEEKSMVGLDMLFWIEQQCREIFPRSREHYFGGLRTRPLQKQHPKIWSPPPNQPLLVMLATHSIWNGATLCTTPRTRPTCFSLSRARIPRLRVAEESARSWYTGVVAFRQEVQDQMQELIDNSEVGESVGEFLQVHMERFPSRSAGLEVAIRLGFASVSGPLCLSRLLSFAFPNYTLGNGAVL
jgi:hypothetical protein